MYVDLHKTSHVIFFAAFLPVLSFGSGWIFAQFFPEIPFWVEGVSPLATYALLFSFFDRIAWKWPVFRWLGIVTVPDVRGRWLGEQTSSYVAENGKHRNSRVIMEIAQTFSQINVQTYYQKWSSNVSASQFIKINGTPTLLIMFDAEPKVNYENEVSNAHKGVAKLVLTPDSLKGTYFNANGQHGELKFKRTGLKLAHTFEALQKK